MPNLIPNQNEQSTTLNAKPFKRTRVQLAKPQQTAYSGRTSANAPVMRPVQQVAQQVRQARQPQQAPAPAPDEQNYLAQQAARQMVDNLFSKYPRLTGGGTTR